MFYEYVKRKYSYADDDCICRRCDMRFHNAIKQDKEDAKGPAKKIKVESVDGNHVVLLTLEQSLMFLLKLTNLS